MRWYSMHHPSLTIGDSNALLICLHCQRPGSDPTHPTCVGIMGTVFDVSGNPAYAPGASYNGSCSLRQRTYDLESTLAEATADGTILC